MGPHTLIMAEGHSFNCLKLSVTVEWKELTATALLLQNFWNLFSLDQ